MIEDNPYQQALALIREGKKEQARPILKQIITTKPHDENAWIWFIDSLAAENVQIKALELWSKVDPQNPLPRQGLSGFLRRKQELEKGSALEAVRDTSSSPKQQEKAIFNDQPVTLDRPLKIAETPIIPTPNLEKATSAKQGNKRLIPLLVLSFIFMLVVVALALYFGIKYLSPNSFTVIFAPTNGCNCVDTDAYLTRVKDRVEKWQTNQSLLTLAGLLGTSPANIDIAYQIYNDELSDQIPRCLKNAHEIFLGLLDLQIKYGESLRDGNQNQAKYYLTSLQIKQDELQQEFSRISRELVCNP